MVLIVIHHSFGPKSFIHPLISHGELSCYCHMTSPHQMMVLHGRLVIVGDREVILRLDEEVILIA